MERDDLAASPSGWVEKRREPAYYNGAIRRGPDMPRRHRFHPNEESRAVITHEDSTYKKLYDLIIGGSLPQGEFLSQRQLAAKVGTSIITLRSALRRLENDGLIESVPKWGVRIPAETPEIVADRYYLREVLECAALRKFSGRLAPDDSKALRALAKECDGEKPTDEAALDRFAAAHLKVHAFIGQLSGSRLLQESLGRLLCLSLMYANAKRAWSRGFDRTPKHHSKLVERLLCDDVDKAESALREHIRRGLEGELEVLQKSAPEAN